jgi:hypothetical protein
MIVSFVAALIGGLIVMGVVLLMIGWGTRMSLGQRIGLCAMAAGLAWSGPARFLGYEPGLADLMFLAGILINLCATHGASLLRAIDRLDGQEDGRLGPVVIPMAEAKARTRKQGRSGSAAH